MPPLRSDKQRNVDGIPVSNLWLLMLYASDLFRQLGDSWTDLEQAPDQVPDLIAEILTHFVEQRIRRNLSFGYRNRTATLSRVRGRINHLQTLSQRLLEKGRVSCRFDEFTVNTPRNRYVLCALEKLTKLVSQAALAQKCRQLAARLRDMGVIGDKPTKTEISQERFGCHDADDRKMMAAAQLVFQLALPTETFGKQALLRSDQESHWLRNLFERGVGGLYQVALSKEDWRITTGTRLYWQTSDESTGLGNVLPGMITDIILDHRPSNHH
jgi:5-methylcytosine-specific restriction enzyme subunit McrC